MDDMIIMKWWIAIMFGCTAVMGVKNERQGEQKGWFCLTLMNF